MKHLLKRLLILTVFLSTAFLTTGQVSLSAPPKNYPYAQIKGDSLEFVFSYSQEKRLRELNEFKKNCYRYVDNLTEQISFRDSLVRELSYINMLHKEKEVEYKKQQKLSNDKFRTLQDKTVELQDLNNKLALKLKDEEISKNKWKFRAVTVTLISTATAIFFIVK